MAASTWSATWKVRATSRCRSSATASATQWRSASASAACNGDIRRSSKSRRLQLVFLAGRVAPSAARSSFMRRFPWCARPAIAARARSSSWPTAPASCTSWKSTRACRSNTRSPSSSPAWTWSSCSCEWQRVSRFPLPRSHPSSTATRSRFASTRKIPKRASSRSPACCNASICRVTCPAYASTPAWSPAKKSPPTTTRCWPKSLRMAKRGRKRSSDCKPRSRSAASSSSVQRARARRTSPSCKRCWPLANSALASTTPASPRHSIEPRHCPAMSESRNSSPNSAVPGLIERARAWAASDPDPQTRSELEGLIQAQDQAELAERMHADLEFGTAGLRGVVAAGSARMNLAVVIRITRALADQLLSRAHDARTLPVVVGCDARLDSQRFADAAARVLLAAGIPVRRFIEPVPTPFVAYAVRAFAANAGIMITASHNPPEYNGYKLYWKNGVQVVPPTDREIFARMCALGPANAVPLADLARQEPINDDIVQRYLAEVRGSLPQIVANRRLRIVYTALHGVGASVVERLFREAGYEDFHS